MSLVKEYATEIKVGALVFAALALGIVFLWLLGDYTPIGRTYNIQVTYNFAGGIELGTPVRVSGIKVGKVTGIKFLEPPAERKALGETALKLKLNIARTVKKNIRKDSKFYINQAGIIGERYVEITPGTATFPVIESGEEVRGVDPPRFDQMISQGMDVFGEVSRIIEENKEGLEAAADAMGEAGKLLNKLVENLSASDVKTLRRILNRLDDITYNLDIVSKHLRADLRPTLADVRSTVRAAKPLLIKAGSLMTDIDDLAQQVRDLPDERKGEIKEILARMTDTAAQLQDLIGRLDLFTRMMQEQYSDIDRVKLEKIVRQFLQEEGVRINVGEVKFRERK